MVNQASNTANLGPSSGTVSVTVNPARSGNTMVLGLIGPTAAPITSLTLSNVSWTLITSQVSNSPTSYTVYLYYGKVVGTGGTTLSVTFTGTGLSGYPVAAQVAEFSNISTTTVVDTSASNKQTVASGTSNNTTSNSLTTSETNELIVAILTNINSGVTESISGGPTNSFSSINTTSQTGSLDIYSQFCYNVEASIGTYSTAQSFTSGTSNSFYGQSIIASFLTAPPASRRRCSFIS